jgi:hypothetical protein
LKLIHSNEDALLSTHVIRDYIDHYNLDYTKSVYIPEVAMQSQEKVNKNELLMRVGVESSSDPSECILSQMMKQLRA